MSSLAVDHSPPMGSRDRRALFCGQVSPEKIIFGTKKTALPFLHSCIWFGGKICISEQRENMKKKNNGAQLNQEK
jgi:hypothetical protein